MKLDKRTAAAVITALCFGSATSTLIGQDGIIMQPRFRQQQAAARAINKPSASTTVHLEANAQVPKTTQPTWQQVGRDKQIQADGGSLNNAGALNYVSSLSLDTPMASQATTGYPSPAAEQQSAAAEGTQPTTAARDGVFSEATFSRASERHSQPPAGLEWVPSGTLPRDADGRANVSNSGMHPSGPIELVNPSFVEPPPRTLASEPEQADQIPAMAVAAEVSISPRIQLASRVSEQIIGDSALGSRQLRPVDLPPGWQAVGQRVSENIASCEKLLRRNAFFSAREEAIAAVLHLCQVLDQHSNNYRSEPAWQAAMQALDEADDFAGTQRLTTDRDLLKRILNSHETPVLKQSNTSGLSPLAAAAHYRVYAEQQLVAASQGHPWLSELFYSLGRTLQAQADSVGGSEGSALRYRAITFYRAATTIDPSNPLAANQLGYVLLQMDRPADARDALLRSLESSASLDAIQNLVEASRRLGDSQLHQWALDNYAMLRSQTPNASQVPDIVEVDQHTFAQLSPRAAGPQGSASTHVANLPNQANYTNGSVPKSQSPAGTDRY